jgi:hypothetical protein
MSNFVAVDIIDSSEPKLVILKTNPQKKLRRKKIPRKRSL